MRVSGPRPRRRPRGTSVPANDKYTTRLIVSEIILELFNGLEMSYPEPSADRQLELQGMRRKLEK